MGHASTHAPVLSVCLWFFLSLSVSRIACKKYERQRHRLLHFLLVSVSCMSCKSVASCQRCTCCMSFAPEMHLLHLFSCKRRHARDREKHETTMSSLCQRCTFLQEKTCTRQRHRLFHFSVSCISCKSVASCKRWTLIEKNRPPRGCFLFTMFPDQEPRGRGPPSKHLVQILRGGSSCFGFLIRKHSI